MKSKNSIITILRKVEVIWLIDKQLILRFNKWRMCSWGVSRPWNEPETGDDCRAKEEAEEFEESIARHRELLYNHLSARNVDESAGGKWREDNTIYIACFAQDHAECHAEWCGKGECEYEPSD